MKSDIKSDDQVDWSDFHTTDESWRTRLLGDLSAQYAIPRYVRLFMDTFGECEDWHFLEVGAGNGEVPLQIRDLDPTCVGRYWVTELFREAPDTMEALKNCPSAAIGTASPNV